MLLPHINTQKKAEKFHQESSFLWKKATHIVGPVKQGAAGQGS
jgi:hypothetical protein